MPTSTTLTTLLAACGRGTSGTSPPELGAGKPCGRCEPLLPQQGARPHTEAGSDARMFISLNIYFGLGSLQSCKPLPMHGDCLQVGVLCSISLKHSSHPAPCSAEPFAPLDGLAPFKRAMGIAWCWQTQGRGWPWGTLHLASQPPPVASWARDSLGTGAEGSPLAPALHRAPDTALCPGRDPQHPPNTAPCTLELTATCRLMDNRSEHRAGVPRTG